MRATRRLIGLCLAVGLAFCPAAGSGMPGDQPAQSVRSKTGTPSPDLRDLYFGEALYHAFQGQYFDAIQRLDTELGMYHGLDQPELDTLHYHINDAEFSVGDFELDYRMHHRAGRAIKAVLEGAVDESVRNEAAFRLARIHFQKGQLDDAMHALQRIQGTVPPQISDDVEFLQLAADRAATAVHSLMMQEDRIAAAALQRSLLPSALPAAAGAQMAARYVPGAGAVGGDWYDVFLLPSGQLGIVIGDVAGSGLPAAVIMGRMRSALRAYALDTHDPAEALRRLDRKMQHFEPGALATVAYTVFDPSLDRVHICSAGHHPPVIAAPGQPAELADVPSGLLIGAAPGARRRAATIDISPGTLMCFYTDGLIERRGHTIDHGLALLCQAVTAQPADTACAAVMAALVGSEPARDDIALLMFRRPPPGTQ